MLLRSDPKLSELVANEGDFSDYFPLSHFHPLFLLSLMSISLSIFMICSLTFSSFFWVSHLCHTFLWTFLVISLALMTWLSLPNTQTEPVCQVCQSAAVPLLWPRVPCLDRKFRNSRSHKLIWAVLSPQRQTSSPGTN